MFPSTQPLTGNNHDQISLLTNFFFIMSHELFRILHSLFILGDNLVTIDLNIDRLLHFVGNDLAHQGISGCRGAISGRGVDEGDESGDGEGIAELFVGHLLDVFIVIVDFSGRWEGGEWRGRGGDIIRVGLVFYGGGVDPLGIGQWEAVADVVVIVCF